MGLTLPIYLSISMRKYMQHEAGHFLVGYLLGVLPRGYEIPSKEALRLDRFAAGKINFVGFEFLIEVKTFLPFIMLLSFVSIAIETIMAKSLEHFCTLFHTNGSTWKYQALGINTNSGTLVRSEVGIRWGFGIQLGRCGVARVLFQNVRLGIKTISHFCGIGKSQVSVLILEPCSCFRFNSQWINEIY